MEISPNIVTLLRESVIYRALYFKSELEESLAKDIPKKETISIIYFMIQILDNVNNQVSKSNRGKTKDIADFEDYVQWHQFLQQLTPILNIIRASSREHLSEASLCLVDEINRRISGDHRFLVIPMHAINFHYQNIFPKLRDLVSKRLKIPEKKHKLQENVAVISYPYIERKNILLHSMMAHEIGHYLIELNKIDKKWDKLIKPDRREIEKIVDYISMKPGQVFQRAVIKSDVYKRVLKQIKYWMRELVADLIAFRLCGPSYLFSLYEFLIGLQDIDSTNPTHPSARIRLLEVLDEFDALEFSQVMMKRDKWYDRYRKKFLEFVSSVRKQLKVEEPPTQDYEDLEIYKIVKNEIDRLKSVIHKDAKNSVGRNFFSRQKYESEVFKLIELLEAMVPPCQVSIGKPADIISILNAGTLFRISGTKNMSSLIKTSKKNSNVKCDVDLLISKAIELSSTHSKFLISGAK